MSAPNNDTVRTVERVSPTETDALMEIARQLGRVADQLGRVANAVGRAR